VINGRRQIAATAELVEAAQNSDWPACERIPRREAG
jgi:hypothetical protein